MEAEAPPTLMPAAAELPGARRAPSPVFRRVRGKPVLTVAQLPPSSGTSVGTARAVSEVQRPFQAKTSAAISMNPVEPPAPGPPRPRLGSPV